MTVFELAQKYYPRLWDRKRIDTLYQAGKLTEEEYTLIIGDDLAINKESGEDIDT